MIINLERFVRTERPYWQELDDLLGRFTRSAREPLPLADAQRLYYLYRRAASDLTRIREFVNEPEVTDYLEGLVARAYAEIHETRDKPHALRPVEWITQTFPQTFRRHGGAFAVALAAMLLGAAAGVFLHMVDPDAKGILLPFGHGEMDPSERVAEEESLAEDDEYQAGHSQFAAMLMSNNIRVSILAMALGLTWGIGTLAMLFYNGVILGAISLDYVLAGETEFLIAWLLPHGSIELPAIVLAGQAGLVLGQALIGWSDSTPLRKRLRLVAPDLTTLIVGVAIMLVWAGLVESFFSQYHEPVLPYWLKTLFGLLELGFLIWYLGFVGRNREPAHA